MTNPLYIHLPDESSAKVELYNMKELVLKNYRYTYMMVLKKKNTVFYFTFSTLTVIRAQNTYLVKFQ